MTHNSLKLLFWITSLYDHETNVLSATERKKSRVEVSVNHLLMYTYEYVYMIALIKKI